MATNITELDEFPESIPLIEQGEPVRGGEDGPDNRAPKLLANRTRFLKNLVETIQSAIDDIKADGVGGVILKGFKDTQAELDAITDQKVGDAWFLNFEMRIWNGTTWGNSGNLRGERGLNLLGVWPNAVPLPEVTQNQLGDAYLWQNDIYILVPNFDPQDPEGSANNPPVWEGLGIRGPDGKSTFELWREIPGNENKTLAQFMAAQKGEKGDDAYQTWLKIPGNEGKSMAEWVEATRGVQGEKGDPRAAFIVAGAKANIGALPTPGDETKAYYVGIDLYVWVEADSNYIMIPGVAGKSAYERWLEIDPDNAGKTEAQFYESLKGEKGADSTVAGPKGDDGRNLRILGTRPSSAEIIQIQDPTDQDAYAAMDTGRLWMYLPLEGGWKDLGPWRGVDGKSAFEVWQDDGNPGGSLAQFWASLRGADGISMQVKGVVATLSALPGSAEEQWIYAVVDERSFYLYLDGAWANIGTYGKDGTDGNDGVDGKSLDIIKILTEEDQVVPVADETTKGKAYISWNPRDVYVNVSGSAWQNAGPFMPLGQQGIQGTAFRPKGTIQSLQNLPNIGGQNGAQEGDTYSVIDEGKKLYTVVDGQWSGPLDIVGPQGKDGPQGTPGALMPIKGVYETMALLRTAHPTGALGDAYMIISADRTVRNLAIWSPENNDWVDTGPAGVKGDKGDKGDKGEDSTVQGPVGSQWLTLATQDAPSNAFNGRTGDWAVNQLLRVYYKTVGGWIYWGQLVAGDVNSPLLSEGKVVRLGNAWVPLLVDEVEGAVDNTFYARKKVGEDNGNPVLNWAALPTIIADITEKSDTKQWVRVFKTGAGTVPVWAELQLPSAGIQDPANPGDTTLYVRFAKTGTWVEYKPAPNDAFQYVQKGGDWIKFDRYDMPIKAMSATGSVNPKTEQVVALDNTSATAKTITLGDGPKAADATGARAQTLIVTVTGAAGVVSFAATGATVLSWHGGTPPTLSGSITNIVFWWTGTRWIGQLGAVVP